MCMCAHAQISAQDLSSPDVCAVCAHYGIKQRMRVLVTLRINIKINLSEVYVLFVACVRACVRVRVCAFVLSVRAHNYAAISTALAHEDFHISSRSLVTSEMAWVMRARNTSVGRN